MKNSKINANVMFRLIRELWYDSEYCQKPIKNFGYRIFEVTKSNVDKITVIVHWKFLLENGVIKEITKDPPVYEFTLKGKNIKTEKDIEEMINNVR